MSDHIKKLVESELKFKEIQAELDTNINDVRESTLHLVVENAKLKSERQGYVAKINELMSASDTIVTDPELTLIFKPSQENKGWGDALLFEPEVTTSILRNAIIVCGGRSGIINNDNEGFTIDWDNLTFIQGPYPTGWGASMKQVMGHLRNSKFISLGRRDWTASDNLVDGHNIYFKPGGDMLIEGNHFHDCAGNSQFANRPWENHVPRKLKLTFKDNIWSNCSWNPTGHGGGGSANLAMYSATDEGTFVDVSNCVWTNTIEWRGTAAAKVGASARGCIAMWNEAFYPAPSKNLVPDVNKYFGALHLKNSVIRTTKSDRSLISIEGTREVVIENLQTNYIEVIDTEALAPAITIDHKEDNPQRAKYIKIDPIDAPGYLTHNGAKIPLREGYSYKEEGYVPVY